MDSNKVKMIINDEIIAKLKDIDHAQLEENEEMTKRSLIEPFIHKILGWDSTNPNDVSMELDADSKVGGKTRKVDYALLIDGEPAIFIEAKALGKLNQSKDYGQLCSYYQSNTNVKCAILTDGFTYWFYTDSHKAGEENTLEKKPFLSFTIENISDIQIENLLLFTKEHYNVNSVKDIARSIHIQSAIQENLEKELKEPSEEFVGLLASDVAKEYYGFKKYSKKTMGDDCNKALKQAIASVFSGFEHRIRAEYTGEELNRPESPTNITDEIKELICAIKFILKDQVQYQDIHFCTSGEQYLTIYIGDQKKRLDWICRIYYKKAPTKKAVTGKRDIRLLDTETVKKGEKRISIELLDEIFDYSDEIRKAASKYSTK